MTVSAAAPSATQCRYAIYEQIGVGGMASVYLGRLFGPASFARTVAIKRLHAHLAQQPEVLAMFLDEARLAARVWHPNVVPTLDVVTTHGEPFLVMDYVHGESLARLLEEARARGQAVPIAIACSIVVGLLRGLHAAHEATGYRGEPLGIVHRDVSPHNIMVGTDGVARVLDFGVAKAVGRLQTTREGHLKGKLSYTAPEILRGRAVTRAADVYSAGVVFWETLTGERLFAGDNEANVLERVLFARIPAPSSRGHSPPALDAVVLRALERDPVGRFSTAQDMARAIEAVGSTLGVAEVGEWVEELAGAALLERARQVARIESGDDAGTPGDLVPSDDGSVGGQDAARAEAPRAGVRGPRGADAVAPSEARPPWAWFAAVVALALGVTALALTGSHRRATGPPESKVAIEPPPRTFAPLSAEAVLPPEASPSEPLTVPVTALPVAASGRRASPAAPAGTTRAAPPLARSTAPPQPSSAAPSGARCDPPWVIDPRGIKQYKLDCL